MTFLFLSASYLHASKIRKLFRSEAETWRRACRTVYRILPPDHRWRPTWGRVEIKQEQRVASSSRAVREG